MDSCEATQMVFARVKSMEPDNVTRIMGYLLLHDTDMFDLAFTTDSELKSAISSAKKQIDLPMEQRLVSDRENPPPFAKNESDKSLPQSGKLSEKRESEMRFLFDLEKDKRFLTESDKRFAESDKRFLSGNEKRESEKRFWSNAEKRDPEKRFLSDNMGLCKNGTVKEEAFSIEELEMELLELLRSRKGIPISISTLPQLYYERFGKRLDSDAYGKNGYGLSKLLSRLSGRLVSLVERPHGQHALMLADDVHKYFVHKAEFDADNFYSGCSRQIYLTFPPDSNFNEEDVTTHFSAYGPVQDVRIPTQHRRMFGFVTFVYTETARLVLAEGNPHHVCGARVLVKPYREKSKPLPRKQQDLEKLFHANDQPKVPSLIGSDAERRLKEEERMVEMEMRMAQIHLRAKAEAEAAAAALLTVNLRNRGLQNIQRDPSAFLDIMDVRSPPRPKNGLQNIQPDSSAFVNNYMMDVHSPPPQQRNGVQNFQTDPSAFLDNYMMEIRSPPGFHKTQPDPSAFLDDYMMDAHSAPRPCLPGAPSRDVHSTPPRSCVPGAPFMDVRSTALSPSVPGAAMDFHSSEPHPCAPGTPVPLSNGFQIPKASVYQLNRDGTCCICFEYFMDLVLLECNHKFCMQCFMKLVKSSKDECPICSWN